MPFASSTRCGRSPRGSRGGPPRSSASTPTRKRSSSSTSAWAPPPPWSAPPSSCWWGGCSTSGSPTPPRCRGEDGWADGLRRAGAGGALRADALPGVLADADRAPAGVRGLLRPPRHAPHPRELRAGLAGAEDPGVLRQQRGAGDAGDRLLVAGDRAQRLHAVALQGGDEQDLVHDDLPVPDGAVHHVGPAAVPPDAGPRHLRYLSGPAPAPRRRARVLLQLGDEGVLRRGGARDGARGVHRRLLALGRVRPDRAAAGAARDRGAGHPLLAVHLERVPVRPDPHREPDAAAHRDHGPVRPRARGGVASHERHRGDGHGPGRDRHAVRPEVRRLRPPSLRASRPPSGGRGRTTPDQSAPGVRSLMRVADGENSVVTAYSRNIRASPSTYTSPTGSNLARIYRTAGAVPNSEAGPTVLGAREPRPLAQVRELPAVAPWRPSCYSDRCPGGSGGRREGAPLRAALR